MKVFFSLLLIVVAILGIFDAGYISYEELSGGTVICGGGFDCGKVLNSPWAHIGPVPLAALGLVYYVFVLVLAVSHYLELNPLGSIAKQLPLPNLIKNLPSEQWLWLTTAVGFCFSLYLVFLMGVIIKAWCLYCLGSAATSSSLFVICTALQRTYRSKPSATEID